MAARKRHYNSEYYNPDSGLFRKLTKLLSGPLVNYRRQSPRQLKRRQLDKYKFKSVGGLGFKKSSRNPFDSLYLDSRQNHDRARRYVDFDQMEFTGLIAAALDIYSYEMTTSSPMRPILNIECSNNQIKKIIEQLFYEVLNIEYNAPGWCRSFCKYGDLFMFLDIDENLGITNVVGLPPHEIERLEGED